MNTHIIKSKLQEKSAEYIYRLRHSAAHLCAHAVLELFPKTKLTIGPPTEDGFFYDFYTETNFKLDQLPIIENKMREIAAKKFSLDHKLISKQEAEAIFKNNHFKLELIAGIPDKAVGLATQGDFYDLCKGGHIACTDEIQFFKLTGISGSYWKADKNNTPLQRIHGVVFSTQEDLDRYEEKIIHAQLYDHRRLGKQLDYFSFHDEGPGFPFFHHKGKLVINLLKNYMRLLLKKASYQEIETPFMLADELWRRSGHYQFYQDKMYFSEIDERSFAIKPMNCPGSILIYKERPRSYRELPLRLHEFGRVHRHELSGVLHGLFRVRAFTIDDTHIYCMPDQIEQEIVANLNLIKTVMSKFGFDNLKIGLSTRPDNAMGSDILWEKAIKGLVNALEASSMPYGIQEGEGAFYGPKIEIKMKDSMDREWQCGTIQLDFFQPENFDLSYVSSEGKYERPVIIHQALYGSLERFFGILLEHYKGNLPFWLTPIQIKILTISSAQKHYAQIIYEQLLKEDIRVEIDHSLDSIAAQIKNAHLSKIPLMIIVGKKEEQNNTLTIRYNSEKQLSNISFEELKNILKNFL